MAHGKVNWASIASLEVGMGVLLPGVARGTLDMGVQRLNAKHNPSGKRFGVRKVEQGLAVVRFPDLPEEERPPAYGSAELVDLRAELVGLDPGSVKPEPVMTLAGWRTAIDALALDEELDITALRTSELVQLLNGKIGVDEEDAVRLGSPAYIVEKDGDTKLLVRVA